MMYQGVKASVMGGFELSLRITDKAQVAARVRAFDRLFEDARTFTLLQYGDGNGGKHELRKVVCAGLRALRAEFLELERLGSDMLATSAKGKRPSAPLQAPSVPPLLESG